MLEIKKNKGIFGFGYGGVAIGPTSSGSEEDVGSGASVSSLNSASHTLAASKISISAVGRDLSEKSSYPATSVTERTSNATIPMLLPLRLASSPVGVLSPP